jgi:hypothetical protein
MDGVYIGTERCDAVKHVTIFLATDCVRLPYLADCHSCGRHVQNEAVVIFPWSGQR